MLNLDTHMLIYALRGDLRERERELLANDSWGVAAIALWELAKLAQLGRIDIDLDDPEVDAVLAGLQVWPLDLEVAKVSTRLDFTGDPADQLIAATSIVYGVPLLTRDKGIRKSKLVPLA